MIATSLALKKAKLKSETGDSVTVLFNPDEYTISRSVNYASHTVPGLDIPIAQFVNGTADTLSMSLFFDTFAAPEGGDSATQLKLLAASSLPESQKPDVRKYTQKVYGMMAVNGDLHAPPRVTFEWGSLKFEGVIISVTQRFTKFTYEGVPVRAVLEVTFQSCKSSDAQLREMPRNSPDRTKYKALREGDRLSAIAKEEYGSCGAWRLIAQENGIENPRTLRSGRTIRIPAMLPEAEE